MMALRFILGCLLGAGVGFGTGYLLGDQILQLDSTPALIVGAVMGVVAGVYSAFAMASRIYKVGFFSILGYVIDVTWSLLNSLAGLAVWIPAALISGAKFLSPDPKSQRSGTFVYDKNPRGGAFSGGATTIGTVIAGRWSSHEEIHVWQARLYGPVYMIIYILSFLLNLLFQLPFRRKALLMDSYQRICFEEWAYWGGDTDDAGKINWGGWVGGFFLTLLYCSLFLSIPLGIALDQTVLWAIGTAGLVLYTLIRAALPGGHVTT
jgi:hypothetical protein